MAVMYGANVFGASSDVSRIVSNKTLEKLDSEHSGELNRSSRRVNVATNNKSDKENKTVASRTAVSRPGVTVRGESTASRGLSKSSGVVSRAGAKNTARTATETNANIVTRTTQTETANSGGATRRSANVMSRPAKENTSERVRQSGTGDSEAKNQERALTSLFRKQVTPTAESITAAKDILEKTADLNSVCQKQYNDCMDQFCAVVDANQKRCSCSDNLNKYAKVQKEVEDAKAQLNEVAQNIRYLGLSADEIRAIMNATEAELELTKTKDTSQTRSMLEDIADMIKDPTSAATSYWSSNNDSMFDLDFDFTSEASDLFSLDFFSSRTNDISSKRGKDLYNEATKRCKTVLKQCKEAGGTESQISGNYDLEISKDCVAYEQGLEKLNQTLLTNVRSANLMLQKGRLAVLKNKNQY
ncbi:MAG: hypothetical protein J6S57_01680, partial [Alphaproteobacteria bacterium]|nr:hypothetical protein [Alphaproteobacteria bacterium]